MDATFRKLINTYREDGSGKNRSEWTARLVDFFSSNERPAFLSELGDEIAVVLHGSTTRNISDPSSDLDFYLLLSDESLSCFDEISSSRFVEITIDGKLGHLNAAPIKIIEQAFDEPDFESIYELQHAAAVYDPQGMFTSVGRRACLPMTERLQYAALFFNYLEMRAFHRSVDNPMDRNDRLSALSSVVEAANYALRCSLIVDGKTFPYAKWLYASASLSPAAAPVVQSVDRILDLLQSGPESLRGPERENEISNQLRQIRYFIVDRAKAKGIDQSWLTEWWHFLDTQRTAFDGLAWPG
jgi:hypothetical protein